MKVIFPTDIPTAVTHKEAAVLADLAANNIVLELGAQFGFSTIVMSQTCRRLHSVDTHQGDTDAGYLNSLPVYLNNLSWYGSPKNVITHVGRFDEVLSVFRAGAFDGCFLDGSHDTRSVLEDAAFAIQLVRPGGWLAFHDYGRYGVREAVDQLFSDIHLVDSLAVATRV